MSLRLTPAVLRTLAEGVSRLRDGDDSDCKIAAEIDADLMSQGYCLSGYDYIPREWDIVASHLHYAGEYYLEVLNPEQDKRLRTQIADGFGTEPTLNQSQDWSHIRDSSPEAITKLAREIRVIRTRRGLPQFPPN